MKRKSRIYSYTAFYEAAPEGGYVATVPALPGCHSQGENIEEAERNVREAIEVYIESLVAHDEDIPAETNSLPRPRRD